MSPNSVISYIALSFILNLNLAQISSKQNVKYVSCWFVSACILTSAEKQTEGIILLTSCLICKEQRTKLQIYKVYSAINISEIYLGPLEAFMLQQGFEIDASYSVTYSKARLQPPNELCVFPHQPPDKRW